MRLIFVEGKLRFNCNFVDHWFLKIVLSIEKSELICLSVTVSGSCFAAPACDVETGTSSLKKSSFLYLP